LIKKNKKKLFLLHRLFTNYVQSDHESVVVRAKNFLSCNPRIKFINSAGQMPCS
jgi:hypothetical protein